MAKRKQQEPWQRENPRQAQGKESQHLTSAEKAQARRSARDAGRPYPNLVDNLRVVNRRRTKKEQ
jgi:hypothetical protein